MPKPTRISPNNGPDSSRGIQASTAFVATKWAVKSSGSSLSTKNKLKEKQ